MSRIVPAARQLLAEIRDVTGKSAEVLDDVDGLGFKRSIRLTPAMAKTLGDDVLAALGVDARVDTVVKSSKGVRVTFVADTRADRAEEFGLSWVVEAE